MDRNKWSRLVNPFSSDYKVSREWKKGVVKTGTGFLANWHLCKAQVLKHCCWENMPSFLTISTGGWNKTEKHAINSLEYECTIVHTSEILLNKALKLDDLPEYLASYFFSNPRGFRGILFWCSRDRWCKRICEMLLKE